jgi:hypothetical protein
MDEKRPIRTRFKIGERGEKAVPAIEDQAEFRENKCSKNAKKIIDRIEKTNIAIWVDKHYQTRHYFGDDNGKRLGIEPERVNSIVEESIKHLIVYSCILKHFTFLNHEHVKGDRALRVVCQKDFGGDKTNVVIEAHYAGLNNFEITVITAIQTNDFQLSDGQFAIELIGDGTSTLYVKSRGKITEVKTI